MGYEGDDLGRRYEIRLVGRLGPALRLAFPGLHATVEPRHRVLLVPADGPDLSTVLGQLGVRHVEVVRIRLRGTAAPPPRHYASRVSATVRVEATITLADNEPVEAWA